MRSTVFLGTALGTLWLAAALAGDSAPVVDGLAQMPPNPVTTPAADKDAPAPPASERHRGRNKQAHQNETASASQASGPGTAASATTANVDAAAQAPAQPKKICHSMEISGSKIPKRVCATQEEWETFNTHAREDALDGLHRLQDQGAVAPASPGVSASQLPP
jgi:hypothetical protein